MKKLTKWQVLMFMFLIIGAFIMFIPLYWLIVTSLKGTAEVASLPIRIFPEKFLWRNFIVVLNTMPFIRYILNSLFVCITVTVLNIFFDSLAGYSLAKFNFPFFKTFSIFVIALMIIPFQIIAIPWYLLMNDFGWLNSYKALIIPESITALGIFMMRQFMTTIPDELIEAARVEGANEFRIFIQFVLPLSKPAITSLAIITFVANWNSFLWPLLAVGSDKLKTAVVGLSAYAVSKTVQYNLLMAASTITIAPVVLLFIILQRYFVQSIASTGIKG
jgi:ABC-type glycerol-3-phosphate transport system permease component